MLQREPCTCKLWCAAGIVLPNEKHVDAAVRELFEETGLTMTVDNLTLLRGVAVRVSFPASKYKIVYVYSASVYVP
jgi:8-oxo-dGTP pyrophosphatase MutT (NUDIX family)